MKKIEAIVRRIKVEDIRAELANIGVIGMTLSQVYGVGSQQSQRQVYRGSEFQDDYLTKVKIEIIVKDDLLDECIEAITNAGRTGHLGDGKLIVYDVERTIRIRTGEEDSQAV